MLFTDLRDSTAQRVLLGDDTFDGLRHEHDRVLATAVTHHSGHVVKSTGDGLHIAFGAASHAIACASAMQRGIARLNRQQPERQHLHLAIGISAGDVVSEDGDLHGTPVVEAARLCATACGGQILVADVARLLAGTRGAHEFESRGELELKGLASPVSTYEVVWQLPAVAQIPLPDRFAPSAGEFVGRDSAREILLRAFKEATTGARQFVFVVGEPGIGKSRLSREAAATMYDAGAVVLAGRCEEGLGGPFQLWIGVLDHLIAHLPDEIIADHVAMHGSEIVKVLPDVRRRYPAIDFPPRPAADSERHRLFEAIASLLLAATADGPMVIVLDDLQWADAPSLQLLRHLVLIAPESPILLIGTYRDTELDGSPLVETLADLRRDELFERVALHGLSEAELSEFLTTRLDHPPSPELVSAMLAETGGNPFFVGEVLAHVVESDLSGELTGSSALDVSVDRLGMFEGVRDLLGQRVARLRRASVQVLEIASVLGREFDLATLASLNRVVESELLAYLDGAIRAGLIQPDPKQPGRYAFTHALVRQKLYGDLGTTRRVRLHWSVGVALQAAGFEDVDAVAYHLTEGVLAGDTGLAVDATLAAGARALQMSAFETAIDHFGNALMLLDQAQIDQAQSTDNERRYAALVGLGDAHVALSNVAGYTEAFLAAAEVARAEGRADRLARVALGIGTHALIVRLAPETAALFDEAIDALGPDDSIERSMLLSYRAFHRAVTPGVAENRHAEIVEAAAIAVRVGDRRAAAQATFARASALRGSPLVDEMVGLADALCETAVELDDIMLQTQAHLIGGTAHLQRGDRAGWQRAAEGLRLLARRPNGTYARPWSCLWETIELVFDERYVDAEHNASAADSWKAHPIVELSFRSQQWSLLRWRSRHRAAADLVRPWVDTPGTASMRAVLACFELDDDPDGGRAVLDHFADDDFADAKLQVAQRPLLFAHQAELCVRTSSTAHAPAIERLLQPYSGQLLLSPSTIWVLGATDTALAGLASLQGHRDVADDRFQRGIALEVQVGSALPASTSRFWYAEHLSRSPSAADRTAARQLVDGCLAHFEPITFHLTDRAERLRAELAG